MVEKIDFHTHQLSPSSWNRFEECPRKYWLSKQKLPKKATMPASVGTVIHNSVEDLCNIDLELMNTGKEAWFKEVSTDIFEKQWSIEKKIFLDTPRHSKWKDELFDKSFQGFMGAVNILLSKAGLQISSSSEISYNCWKTVQKIIIVNEGSLVSECGKITGRLDLLLSEIREGKTIGWIVADLKTGKPPRLELDKKVSRQLRLYRDLVEINNPNHPPIKVEGWYSNNQKVYIETGPSVINEAFEAWKKMSPSDSPLQATPDEKSCSFCEWKAWCPSWWIAVNDGIINPGKMFRDEVAKLIRFDKESAVALFERLSPDGNKGKLQKSDYRFGAFLKDKSLEKLVEISKNKPDIELFLGSIRFDGKTAHLGDWSEIIEWNPLQNSKI